MAYLTEAEFAAILQELLELSKKISQEITSKKEVKETWILHRTVFGSVEFDDQVVLISQEIKILKKVVYDIALAINDLKAYMSCITI